ncbi:MAG: 3-dehydroquinate synthase [Candidatus Accumulibacter sp.]|nr:3-dehydroquinate synthase [Accumulibacter sp.]
MGEEGSSIHERVSEEFPSTIRVAEAMAPDHTDTKRRTMTTIHYQPIKSLVDRHQTNAFYIVDENALPESTRFPQAKSIILKNVTERNKNLDHVTRIIEQMLEMDVDRGSTLVGVGGGITTDIVGFIASIYNRGMNRLVLVPTTLLGMIDAAIGGKNGVNFNRLKNYVGTFRNPDEIYIDYTFLDSLPKKHIDNSLGEIIKYNLLGVDVPISTNPMEVVPKCVEYKQRITNSDFHDSGDRRLLNFGHTMGHAFESLSDMSSHGFFVLLGLFLELQFSKYQKKSTSEKFLNFIDRKSSEIKDLLLNVFPDEMAEIKGMKMADVCDRVILDKKRSSGLIGMPLLDIDCVVRIEEVKVVDLIHFLCVKEDPFSHLGEIPDRF